MHTICLQCKHVVPAAPGYCVVCGRVFSTTTILKLVAARENDSQRIESQDTATEPQELELACR